MALRLFSSNAAFQDPFFGDLFDWSMRLPHGRRFQTPRQPHFELTETEDKSGLVIRAELPGLSKDKLNVSVDGRQLTVSYENTEETSDENGLLHSKSFSSFSRSWTLPDNVDANTVRAKHDNGVLSIRMDVSGLPPTQQRQITID